jgi:glycosyltransferase involved in cell wall biosynthesis
VKIILKQKREKNKGVVFSKRSGVLDVSPEKALKLSKIYDIEVLEHIIDKPKKGKNVIFLQELIYKIGGIEEFLTNIVTEYEDYDITLYYKKGDPEQLINLSKFVSVKKFNDNSTINCDVMLISNHTISKILDSPKVSAKKKYGIIHANFKEIRTINDLNFHPHPKLDGYITVSKSAHDGLKELYGIESKIIYNFISEKNIAPKMVKFITLSRATKEKGIDLIVKLCEMFKEQGKIFIWFLCATLEQLEDEELLFKIRTMPEIVLIPPSINNKDLIGSCDYVAQLSKSDSYCYSLREGLKRNVPILTTNFQEAYNFLKEGKNGYMLKMDLSNVDVDKIFNKIPKQAKYIDECNKKDWINIFEKGEIDV